MATIVTLISDTIAPTERSKLPLIIIQQTPTVTIPLIEDWRSTLIRLRAVRKRGFRIPINTTKATVRTTCGSLNRKLPRLLSRPRPRNMPGMIACGKVGRLIINQLRLSEK